MLAVSLTFFLMNESCILKVGYRKTKNESIYVKLMKWMI